MNKIGPWVFSPAIDLAAATPSRKADLEKLVTEFGNAAPAPFAPPPAPGFARDALRLVASAASGAAVASLTVYLIGERGLPGFAAVYPWELDGFRRPARPCQVADLVFDSRLAAGEKCWADELAEYAAIHFDPENDGRRPPSERTLAGLGLLHLAAQVTQALGATHLIALPTPHIDALIARTDIPWAPLGPEGDGAGRAFAARATDAWLILFSLRGRALSRWPETFPPAEAMAETALAAAEGFHLAGFDFTVATAPEQLREIYELRRRIAPWAHQVRLRKPGGGPLADPYDPWSIHAAATDRAGRVVGSFRLTLNSPIGLASLEAARPDEQRRLEKSKKVAELSGLTLAQPYAGAFVDVWSALLSYPLPAAGDAPTSHQRHQGAVLILGLFRLLYRISKTLRLTGWLTLLRADAAEVLTQNGFTLRSLGAPVDPAGRSPHFLAFSESEKSLFQVKNIRGAARDLARLARGNERWTLGPRLNDAPRGETA